MSAGTRKPSNVSEVISAIGYGPAQVYTQILAHGIWVVDGIEFAMVTALAKPIARELHLSDVAMASIVAVLFVGTTCGCAISGVLGDSAGRRSAVLLCYVCVTIFTLAIAYGTVNFCALIILRFLLGISMGIGMPASLALVSEMSPPRWRETLSGIRGIIFAGGGLIACLIVVSDSPTLVGLTWRVDLTISVIPSVILGLLAICFLQESPMFLAQSGQHNRAREVLKWMRHRNSAADVDVDYESAGMEATAASPQSITCLRGLGIIYGRHLAYTTCTLGFAAFVLNVIEYGSAYAEPRVLQHTHASLPAGWQLFFKYLVAMPLRGCAIPIAAILSRRASLKTLTLGCATGVLIFAWTGSLHHRSLFLAAVYYMSQYMTVLSVALGYLVVYQASVDLYPTLVSATGSAVCLGCGRVGGMVAPYLFELVTGAGQWQRFYCAMAVMGLIAGVLCSFLPDEGRAAEQAEAAVEDLKASEPLVQP